MSAGAGGNRLARLSTGSSTNVLTAGAASPPVMILRLEPRRRLRWASDVVDNEGHGKRKSKKCCIYHKKREFGESSSECESTSASDSEWSTADSDGSDAGDRALPAGRRRARRRRQRHRRNCTCEDDVPVKIPERNRTGLGALAGPAASTSATAIGGGGAAASAASEEMDFSVLCLTCGPDSRPPA